MPESQAGPRPLPRSAPREQGVDARGVLAFVDALEAAPAIEPHSLVVVRHGHVVAEGWWHPYTPDGLQLLYSLSKTFTATAVGLAVAEGLLSLDDTVLGHFPELDAEVTDPRVRRLRVRHVAAMASGHETETIDRAESADPADVVRGFLLTPPEREPGSVFAYNQPCTSALGAIVARRSGQSLTEYLRPRLLDPLGIAEVAWSRDSTGRDLAYSGLHATTDAIARLGLLHLQEGWWDGRQLVPREWVAEAASVHVTNDHTGSGPDWSQGYGFQLWRSRHGYRGDGAYGQFCLVLPEQDAVVAMTAATEDLQGVLDAAWAHLLPALGGGTSTAAGPGDAGPGDAAPGDAAPGDAPSDETTTADAPPDDAPPGDATTAGATTADAAAADTALSDRLARLSVPTVVGDPRPPAAGADAWDGFTGRAAGPGPVASVRLDSSGDGWRLTLVGSDPVDAATPLVADVGTQGWAVSRSPTPDGPLPLGVSGAWASDATLRVDVVFLETPHRLALNLRPGDGAGGGTVDARWRTTPLGHVPLVHLRAPRR